MRSRGISMTKQRHHDQSAHPRGRLMARWSGIVSCADHFASGRRLGVIALVVSFQLLGSGCARRQDEATPKSTPEFTPVSDELVTALRRGGVRAAAQLVRHFVGVISIEDDEAIAPDAESLCRYSELVVLAKAVSRSPGSLSDGDSWISEITTDYSMVIEEPLHGPRGVGTTITVVMAGGFIEFPDGTTALTRSGRGLPEIQIGSRYVLFLQGNKRRPGLYRPFLAEQGVFGVDGGRVFSRGRAVDEVFKKYHGMKETDFLSLVRSATCK